MNGLEVITVVSRSPDPALEYESNCHVAVVDGRVWIVDAGYGDERSLEQIVEAVRGSGRAASGILLTHGHPDHASGVARLARRLGCPAYAHPAEPVPRDGAVKPLSFSSDGLLAALPPGWPDRLEAIHTPGHTHGHIALFDTGSRALFSGDTAVGSGTVWIGPPDGHLADYLKSLDRIAGLSPAKVYAGHGPDVGDPAALIQAMKDRRLRREAEILAILRDRPCSAANLADTLYRSAVAPEFFWAAVKTVQGHLAKLADESAILGRFDPDSKTILYSATSKVSPG